MKQYILSVGWYLYKWVTWKWSDKNHMRKGCKNARIRFTKIDLITYEATPKLKLKFYAIRCPINQNSIAKQKIGFIFH